MELELGDALLALLLIVTQGLTWQRVHRVEQDLQDRVERRLQSNRRMTQRRAADRAAGAAEDAGRDRPGQGRRVDG